jgi:hypothetical protein
LCETALDWTLLTMKQLLIPGFLIASVCLIHAQPDVKVWTRTTAGSSYDFGYAVAADRFGNGFIAGATQGSVTGGGNAGRYDLFVAKYNSEGTRLWVRQRGTDEREFAFGAATDPSGNVYLTGYTGNALDGQWHAGVAGDFDVFVMKHDPSGNWQWTRVFGFAPDDEGRAIATDHLGNVYVTGYVRGALDNLPRPGSADVFLRKYDPAGNKLWSALFGSPDVDESFGIACDATGNIFVTGWCSGSIDGITTNLGNGDNFLAKYNSNGQQLWLKQWGTVNKDTGYSLATDAAGNVYVSGYSTGPLYGPPLGERDVFLAKFDGAGNELWGKKIGTTGHDQGWGAVTDAAGNVYVAGETSGPLDGNTYAGGLDVFLTKYDSTGARLWTTQYGTIDGDWADGVAITTNGVYVGGTTWASLDGNANQGLSDSFLSRFAFATNVPPMAPVALAAMGVTSNAFTARWNASATALGYRLDVSTNFAFSDYLSGHQDLDVGNVTNRTVTGLIPTATYFYRVRAYNVHGSGGNSGVIPVTLASASPCASLLNSDFEGGFSLIGGGYIANQWTEWEAAPGVTIGYDETGIVHGGAHSQRIRVGSTNATSGGIYQRIPVIAGYTYTASVWIYAGDDQSACSLGVDPAGGTNALGAVIWSSVTTNVGWAQKTWTGAATANQLTMFYRVASSDSTKRNGYFDDASPGGSAVPPTLMIQRGEDALTLTWLQCPAAHLEHSPTLGVGAGWTATTNQVTFEGGQKSVTVAPSAAEGFFRLVLD